MRIFRTVASLLLAASLLLGGVPGYAAQQIINTGTGLNTGDGDPARTAFTKTNANFTELYAYGTDLSGVTNLPAARTNLGLGSIATLAAPSGTVVGTTDTQTLSNKLFINTTNSASVQVVRLDGDRASPANNDAAYQSYYLSNGSGTQTEVARLSWVATNVTAGAEAGRFNWALASSGSLATRMSLLPSALIPATDGTLVLGASGVGFAGEYLSSGTKLDWAAGDYTLTHSTGVLTANKDFRVTTVGTNTASVLTVDGSQSVNNKNIATPTLTLKQSSSPTPTAEGDVQWDTDDDQIVVGNGASQTTFYPLSARVLFQLIGANMNSTADQGFTKIGTFSNYIVQQGRLVNASTSLTTATGGIYDTASKGGTPLVAASQSYSTATGSTMGVAITFAAYGLGKRSVTPILALTNPQGSAATADIYIIGVPLP